MIMGRLTPLQIRNLKEPGRYNDGDGLFLELTGPNKGNWQLRATVNGRRRDIGLGSMALVSLKEARDAAFELRRDIQRGIDPVAERKRRKLEILTFKAAALRVHAEQKASWKNGKHQDQWITTLENYAFPVLGNRLVNDIEGPLIREVLLASGMRPTEAPMRSVNRVLPRQPKKDGHFAAMPYDSVPLFMTHLHARLSVPRLALEFLILTAARSGKVRGAKWNEIDLEAKLWTIPASRMKVAKEHVVPLSVAAIDVLERARQYHAPCGNLLFPGRDVRRPLSDMTLLKILRCANIPYTVHGFRSAFRDWAAEQTSYPGEVAEAALAHTVANKVEAAYRRTNYLDKRCVMMADWAIYCTSQNR